MVGIDKSECFRHLVDRVLARISGWKEKLLSLGGKEILINAIAQAIPVFAMMVFKIPKRNIRRHLSILVGRRGREKTYALEGMVEIMYPKEKWRYGF
jgi:hypothetical protein